MAQKQAYRGTERREVERRSKGRRSEDKEGASERKREERKHPRRFHKLRVQFSRPSRAGNGVDFSATADTRDLSVGGAYFQSSFFIKAGTKLRCEVTLPSDQVVLADIEVVYVNRDDDLVSSGKPVGFAVRFLRFHDDGEIYLRAFLARGDVYRFVSGFLEKQPATPLRLGPQQLVELIVRWEMLQETLGR